MNATLARFLYIQVALVLAVAACATSNGPYSSSGAAPALAGTHWVVTRIDGSAPRSDANLHADFGVDGRVNGNSGCNSFSGPFIQNNSTVQIGELLSTRRACVDTDRQRQETRMLNILQGATTARLDRGQLSLRGADGTLVLSQGSVQDTAYNYPKSSQFDCKGTGLTVKFETGQALLTWRDGQDTLNQKSTASGIWYESSHNSLRGIQQDLVWTRDGHGAKTCRELR
jgi:heat shock protein HslJ